MSHAQESGHWYGHDGKPVWEVMGRDKMVTPDIRHARKLGLLPGTTSISKCAAAPGLEIWKRDQVLMSALTLPRMDGEGDEALKARILKDADEQARKAAERGTAIHAAIQEAFGPVGISIGDECFDCAMSVVSTIFNLCGPQVWIAEQSFAHEAGYGGKVDLHCAGWILDVKTKDAKDLDDPAKKLVWDDHPQQLAAYRRGLKLPGAQCANIFVSRDRPIIVKTHVHEEADLVRGLRMFDHLLGYWQEKNRYQSAFLREAA